jgi:lipoprotein-anchoring transpeptidase ErfK/SrfK
MLSRGSHALGRPGLLRRLCPLALVAVAALAVASPAWSSGRAPQLGIVAQATGKAVYVYRSPGARQRFLTLYSPTAAGAPLVFLVKRRVPGWDEVYLPVRPNDSTGWIRESAVQLALDPYRVEVSLSRHRISVWKGSRLLLQTPAGVGRTVLPTPPGVYFLVVLLKQQDSAGLYGPYAFGTSAFSDKLYHFGAGPGQIGLHGTNYPAGLGTNVSHGCIRISNDAITKLAHLLPLGTPLLISR